MTCHRGHYPVDCDGHGAASAVLEPDGHAEPARHDPVCLTLGGSSSYGAPGDEVTQVLGGEGFEKLGGGG